MTTAKSRNRRSEAIVLIVLFLLPCLFFWRLLAPNPADRATIPAGDFTEQYYPLHLSAARDLGHHLSVSNLATNYQTEFSPGFPNAETTHIERDF